MENKTTSVLFLISFLFCNALINCSKALNNKLYVYAWSETIPKNVIKKFENETGIKVFLSTYDSNETMFSKIKLLGNQPSYDIVFPSTYFVQKMVQNGLLTPLEGDKISNIKYIKSEVLNLISKEDKKYIIPYVMYFTGILYNNKHIKEEVNSWEDLWNAQYKNKVLIIDDIREVFSIALILLGYNPNSINKDEIMHAYQKLRKLLPNVKLFSSESIKDYFLSEEVIIGMSWNADAFPIMLENKDLKFVYPKEGAILSIDNFAILKSSKNKDNAYKFINFLLKPEIAAECIKELYLSIPNNIAYIILIEQLKNTNLFFLKDSTIKISIINHQLSKNINLYDNYWFMINFDNY